MKDFKPVRAFVTGGAGFIGSTLVDRLVAEEAVQSVVVYDNFSTGREAFLAEAKQSPKLTVIRGDILNPGELKNAMAESNLVFHLAANADVRFGTHHPNLDLEQNTIGTFNVLEAMRANDVRRLVFSSTGSVYGEASIIPTPEDHPFPIQTSLYGASKLAGESLIQAYCEGYGFQGSIFRFVGILGERYTHGHVVDFFKKLRANPKQLEVLGNGRQRKSYLYVHDCIDAIFCALEKATAPVNIFNLGTDQYCEVTDSIGWITSSLAVDPELVFTGGDRGWIGDNPFIFLDTTKIRKLGWQPKLSIEQGIKRTLSYLQTHEELMAAR
jgi:UDP-glucose 4-epimerase